MRKNQNCISIPVSFETAGQISPPCKIGREECRQNKVRLFNFCDVCVNKSRVLSRVVVGFNSNYVQQILVFVIAKSLCTYAQSS